MSRAHVVVPSQTQEAGEIAKLLAKNPLGPTEKVHSALIEKGENSSLHLVQIRDREEAHVHANHDLAVTLVKGSGILHINQQERPMQAGDVAWVPQRTPHFFVNTGSSPAVAIVSFSPAYDGRDQVPMEKFKPRKKK